MVLLSDRRQPNLVPKAAAGSLVVIVLCRVCTVSPWVCALQWSLGDVNQAGHAKVHSWRG